jgi:hypothetical protein
MQTNVEWFENGSTLALAPAAAALPSAQKLANEVLLGIGLMVIAGFLFFRAWNHGAETDFQPAPATLPAEQWIPKARL